jgi:hypothetical protein
MARHCRQIREKHRIIPGRYPYQVYLFLGFNLVTTLSQEIPGDLPEGLRTVRYSKIKVALMFFHGQVNHNIFDK